MVNTKVVKITQKWLNISSILFFPFSSRLLYHGCFRLPSLQAKFFKYFNMHSHLLYLLIMCWTLFQTEFFLYFFLFSTLILLVFLLSSLFMPFFIFQPHLRLLLIHYYSCLRIFLIANFLASFILLNLQEMHGW